MRKYISKFKRILGVFLVVGLLLGLSGPIYAQTEIKVQPSSSKDLYELKINDEVVIRFRSLPQSLSAGDRSKIILERISLLNSKGIFNSNEIKVQEINGMPTIAVGGQVLATVTSVDLKANNSTSWGLIQVWQNNFKRALEKKEQAPTAPKKSQKQPIPSKPTPQPSQPAPSQPEQSSILSVDEQKMLNLVNQERAKAGLAPLKVHSELVKLARLKSQDMISNKYFSHQSPRYGSPFDMMKSAGVSYTRAGENLAGAPTVESAHTNLMNSPGHRANILNKDFTHIGIGIIDGGQYGKMFTQMFIRP
ncbi:MAG: hypothetical protein APF76_14740 [Desulfitibacter sp. BRH_c19]|nr:MAG: hypothetical protein APF76_14740 [Desulfitibacter sp. BRH_c19]